MIVISDYDERWPQSFTKEKAKIEGALSDILLACEHIGSTSVPGLAAKPIIDIMPGVRDIDCLDASVEPMRRLGFEYISIYEDELPERRYFRKRPDGLLLVRDDDSKAVDDIFGANYVYGLKYLYGLNVHLVPYGSPFWLRHLKFRDILRNEEDVRRQYESLKRELALKYHREEDINNYAGDKSDFVAGILGAR